jgi:hypothetical protein
VSAVEQAARRVASVVVPERLKRRHEAWSTARFRERANQLGGRYAAEHGLTVKRGPFAGLRYPEEFLGGSSDIVAKLVGLYELELRGVFENWIAAGPGRVVDVGCSEGLYAVGLALASSSTTVHAFDIDPEARERCRELAELNGVADRVVVAGECTPAILNDLAGPGAVVLVDCEGCEATVLDPASAPALAASEVLVELHDFIDPTISGRVLPRFERTHEIALIDARPREEAPPELASLAARDRRLILSERRPPGMRWARLRPRTGN